MNFDVGRIAGLDNFAPMLLRCPVQKILCLFCILLCVLAGNLIAQDSLPAADSSGVLKSTSHDSIASVVVSAGIDSLSKPSASSLEPDTTLAFFNQLNPFLATNGKLFYRMEDPFQPVSSDRIFYWLAGAVLILGIIRMIFSKYFVDMLRIFSQTTFRQKSIRDQLVQNRLASLLMNLFFCFSAGTFLFQFGQYRHWFDASTVWWQQSLICIAFIAIVYLVKYLTITLSGWLFGLRELADTYTFMVFLVNKVVGIILLPASIALALGVPDLKAIAVVASLFALGFLFLYRYVLAIPLLRQHIRVIPFHFFIYFCAFEIVPVLVIYKWMLSIISQ